jgi:hypothetical protein
MATWITPWSSRSVNVVGTRTRRQTMGLMPTSQTLTCRIALASAAGSEGITSGTEGFIGLPHDAACERFHEQDRRVRTASAAQVRRPINRDGLGRYHAYAEQLAPLIAELERAGLLAGDASG